MDVAAGVIRGVEAELQRLQRENEDMQERLERIVDWCAAYPVGVFIPLSPDEVQLAASVLREAGISMDGLHAGWARHLLQGISSIAAATDTPEER